MLDRLTPQWIDMWLESPPIISGEDAFQLYDTYGFPLDLTELMAEERGLTVDVEGFHRCMQEQRERSQAAAKGGEQALTLPGDAIARLKHMNVRPTDDSSKFAHQEVSALVRAIWNGRDFDDSVDAVAGLRRVGILLDKTCFYSEAGGQVADRGTLAVTQESQASARDEHKGGRFRVEHVQSFGGYVLHIGIIERGELRVGDNVIGEIDRSNRPATMANHTMTHVMNFALREVLGEGVDQKGSLVAPDRLRFDFSHGKPVSAEEIGRIEAIVREQIERDLPVHAKVVPLEQAKRIRGLRAVFGEVYPDPVRVVSVGADVDRMVAEPEDERWLGCSVEFCGGTHLSTTGEAGEFAIVTETGVAKGIRRIEALTGVPARAARSAAESLGERLDEAAKLDDAALKATLGELSNQIDSMTMSVADKEELRTRHRELVERIKAADKQTARARAAEAVEQAKKIGAQAKSAGARAIVEILDLGGDRQAMQQAMQTIRDACPDAAVMILSIDPEAGSVAIAAGVPKGLIEKGLKAGDWVRVTADACGGKGGGKPDQAQGGGKDAGKIEAARAKAREFADGKLG